MAQAAVDRLAEATGVTGLLRGEVHRVGPPVEGNEVLGIRIRREEMDQRLSARWPQRFI